MIYLFQVEHQRLQGHPPLSSPPTSPPPSPPRVTAAWLVPGLATNPTQVPPTTVPPSRRDYGHSAPRPPPAEEAVLGRASRW